MFQRILFPTDFSEPAVKAKGELKKLSDCKVGEVHLMHVVDIRMLSFSEMLDSVDIADLELRAEFEKTARSRLQRWKKELEELGFTVHTHVKYGIPFVEIMEYAKETGATLIMMGHRGHGAVEEVLLGSTAEKVARKAPIPVLLVK